MRRNLLLLAVFAFAADARCDDFTSGSQLSVRIGLVSNVITIGETSNKVVERVSVPESLEFDYEIFSTNRRSFFLRGTMAYDLSIARVAYLFIGGGMRFYLLGNAMSYDRSDADGNRVSSSPTSRLFIGPDFGLSKVEVVGDTAGQGPSSVLAFSSTNYDIGAHAGYILQLSRSFGVEVLTGASFVYGFTTVSAVGASFRAMIGITQYF